MSDIAKLILAVPYKGKVSIVTIGVFMPCWFLLFFYFFPTIIAMQWYYVAALVFVPSLLWFISEILITYLVVGIVKNILKGKTITIKTSSIEIDKMQIDNDAWKIFSVDGILYLLIFGIIAYYSKMSFEKFLWVCFLIRYVWLFFFLIIYWLSRTISKP